MLVDCQIEMKLRAGLALGRVIPGVEVKSGKHRNFRADLVHLTMNPVTGKE